MELQYVGAVALGLVIYVAFPQIFGSSHDAHDDLILESFKE